MAEIDGIQSLTMNSVAEMDAYMTRSYAPVRTTSPTAEAFVADVRMHRSADVIVGFVHADAHVIERTAAMIAGTPPAFVNIGVVLSGSGFVRQFDREIQVSPGDIFLSEPDAPYAMEFVEPFELIFFLFPRRMIGLSTARLHALAATRLEVGEALARITLDFIRSLERDLGDFAARSATRLLRNTIDLLATVVDEAAVTAASQRIGVDRDIPLSERARAYIEVNLGDADLTPQRVAEALYISARHLHGVFRGEGVTVGEFIRQRRIERCRRDLIDPDLAALTVSEIGARWGFDDASHFSRTFRREEGIPPSEYRRRHARQRSSAEPADD